MTAAGEEPTSSITDIATHGMWAAGPTINPSAVRVARALLAALQGEADGSLPEELSELTASVREKASVGLPSVVATDGIRLSAFSIKLNDGNPHPVVIVPAGWNPYGWLPFLYSYLALAKRGYHVLAYTPRGIGDPALPSTSEGYVDVAGPKDWADGSAVIDYAQAHFEPSGIGFLGESYGSGISQLVAAHDPEDRVSAVVALSTWGNLATSLYDNGTRHLAAVQALIGFTGGSMDEKFDEETRQVLTDFLHGRNLDEVVAWGTERSPESYADVTNRRKTATFVSNTWHESLFPAGQTIDTFNRLTVPKRLNMWIGDHGAPEGPGLSGLLTSLPFPGLREPMREAYAWLDHHLLGAANEVPNWSEVSNQVMFAYETAPLPGGTQRITTPAYRETHAAWDDVTTSSETWYLSGTAGSGDGELAATAANGWSRGFTTGNLTEATAMDAVMQTGQKEWTGNPKTYDLEKFDRAHLLVWSTEPLSGPGGVARRIRGTATVRLTVRSTSDAATLVAYLFDIAADGTARIITHEPCTATDLTPNTDRSLDWRLQPVAYDLPDGHRLALVVNSRDQLYSFADADEDSTTTVGSPGGHDAGVEIPLG
ncbi:MULTISPECIES: CocE/NonD family hydrolase C-terminal non-catalytic domain-containing protein [unclassified Streptomyces]|uniref:CocE/NonD family hydrolase C-terminal non-catalytic domain-containing protein n=1 Tax=unclassified Streptomyces TaxID=2593676 RepID=UPI00381E4EA4